MSDHGARALVLAAVALLAGAALLWWLAGRPSGVEDLLAAVESAAPGDVVRVDEVVDVPWDALHVFAPLTPPQEVEDAVGARVGAVRGLMREGVLLLVLTDGRGRVTASGLAGRTPVDWLPVARDRPYRPEEAVFTVVGSGGGRALAHGG